MHTVRYIRVYCEEIEFGLNKQWTRPGADIEMSRRERNCSLLRPQINQINNCERKFTEMVKHLINKND